MILTTLGPALWIFLAALGVAIAGLVLIGIALLLFRYRAKWVFWFLLIYSIVIIPVVPIGTVLAAFFITYCLMFRNEFLATSGTAAEQ